MGYFSGFALPPGTVVNPTMGPGGAASLLQVNGINALSVSNFEQLLYFGVNATDIITGGAGNDIIAGESGDDRLFGGNGDDTLDSGTGIVDMDGGQGFDVAHSIWAAFKTGSPSPTAPIRTLARADRCAISKLTRTSFWATASIP